MSETTSITYRGIKILIRKYGNMLTWRCEIDGQEYGATFRRHNGLEPNDSVYKTVTKHALTSVKTLTAKEHYGR